MSDYFIIMMRGFTATGKSVVAQYLAKNLKNTVVLHTAKVREELNLTPDSFDGSNYNFDLRDEVFVNKISPLVYNEMIKRAKKALLDGKNVILDGTYNFIWQRKQVSDLSSETGSKLYIIKCVCSSEEEIKRRLERRRLHSKNSLNEATLWETYISTRDFSDTFPKDEFHDTHFAIIEYDSLDGNLRIIDYNAREKNDKNLQYIYNTLKGVNDYVREKF